MVWAPDADGTWPVVYALHGRGYIQDWDEMATILAGQGVVVFAADHRSELMQTEQWRSVYEDAECGYRYARSTAAEYGGDLGQPVTVIGHSLGATLGLGIGLFETVFGPDSDGSFDQCPGETPRPDVIVGIAGCHYESPEDLTLSFDPSGWGWANHQANVSLVVGSDDNVCEAWQSKDATAALQADGYRAALEIVDDADHLSVIFHAVTDGEFLTLPNDPGGLKTAHIILDAIDGARS